MPQEHFTQRQRRLPHWEERGRAYFLTWHCVTGLALAEADRDLIAQNLRHWEGLRYLLYAAVVMPTHVHSLLTPLQKQSGDLYSLSEILHGAKSYTAHEVNHRLHRSGGVWQEEGFDRLIRDQRHFDETITYIVNNPVKWGLVEKPDDYPWLLHQEKW